MSRVLNTESWSPTQHDTFNVEKFEQLCEEVGDRLKMVSLSQVGNLDGISIPMIKKIAKITHQYDALIAADGAQSTPHMRVDVQDLDIDFISFSIHKMCGPSGMGGLWGRYDHSDSLRLRFNQEARL